jgi:acetyltransferase-like isoleucine patch superfamily enzyme
VQPLLDAGIRYATNHLVTRIPSDAIRHAWYHRVLGWYLGPNAAICTGQQVQVKQVRASGRRVSIGAGTVIDHDCLLSTTGGLLIGEHVCISAGVWLVTGNRDLNDPRFAETYQPIVIDDYAWIGPRAMVLGGITIGRRAIIQAGAVVTQDVEPNRVVAGVPATVVGMRARESIPRAGLSATP